MMHDPHGTSLKWWNWALSGALVIGGIVLCATGVGAIAGAAMIGAGIGSMVGGYIAESYGYDFNVGYGIGLAVGDLIGGGIAYVLPYIGSFLTSQFIIGGTVLATGEIIGGLTITGTQIMAVH